MASFLNRLESVFLDQLEDREIPPHLDPKDGEAVRAWFREAFTCWFLQHRDDVLGREWARRGWAEYVPEPTESGELKGTYQVKPECVDKIDAWLQDEID